ncbi:MAG TPA: lysylphosphatidylglycerol synthase domain-containing protein [Terriglobales bacterium]|nr:lysylphosphatidylglycerol synthase domain-containing protein [Terriglobales bacterium]
MTWRRVLLSLLSAALGLLLIVALVEFSKIDWRATLLQLRSVSWMSFGALVVLNALLILFSTLKWRSVDAVLRRSSDSTPSRAAAFAITSIGMAIGLVLPVQVGMTIARTLGTYFHGGAFRRGTAGTLLEQSFDLLIVAFLAIASTLTWLTKGEALVWFSSAGALTLLALLLAGPLIEAARNFTALDRFQNANPHTRFGKLLRGLAELRHSGLLNTGLARRLLALSALRFTVIVLMSYQTAQAIGSAIPLWQFAAAVPFVVVVTVVAVTPGGVGINELTSVTALKVFGTPVFAAADWALANRLLVMASCFVIAGLAAVFLLVRKLLLSKTGEWNRNSSPKEI